MSADERISGRECERTDLWADGLVGGRIVGRECGRTVWRAGVCANGFEDVWFELVTGCEIEMRLTTVSGSSFIQLPPGGVSQKHSFNRLLLNIENNMAIVSIVLLSNVYYENSQCIL